MTTQQTDWMIANGPQTTTLAPLDIMNRWWSEMQPRLPFRATTREEFTSWQRDVRQAVQERLGWQPPALPLQPVIRAEGLLEPGVRFRFGEVETAPGMTVPFVVLVPEGLAASSPAVLCIHGHGHGMNPLIGLDEAGNPLENEYQHAFALEACRRGFVSLTFDMLCFGRRRDFLYNQQYKLNPCDSPSKIAIQLGASMLGLRVFDARQMLTLLGQQPEVDADRLGMSGISGGGTITFFTTLLDDRVRAANISGYFNRFSAFMQVPHCVDNFVPALATVAEAPDLGCAIAPRPVLINQGTRDPIFPIEATRAGVEQLRTAYRLFAAESHVEEEYYDAEHVYSNARVWDFFRENL